MRALAELEKENHTQSSEKENLVRKESMDGEEDSGPESQSRVKRGGWGDGDYVELGRRWDG